MFRCCQFRKNIDMLYFNKSDRWLCLLSGVFFHIMSDIRNRETNGNSRNTNLPNVVCLEMGRYFTISCFIFRSYPDVK